MLFFFGRPVIYEVADNKVSGIQCSNTSISTSVNFLPAVLQLLSHPPASLLTRNIFKFCYCSLVPMLGTCWLCGANSFLTYLKNITSYWSLSHMLTLMSTFVVHLPYLYIIKNFQTLAPFLLSPVHSHHFQQGPFVCLFCFSLWDSPSNAQDLTHSSMLRATPGAA